jgi:GMP synthase-like glutamine amidotransferase
MNIHWIQHVPFEGLGCIAPWLIERGYALTCTRLWADDSFPEIGSVNGLIVMGGPMGVYDEDQFSWLAAEKAFIREAIDQQKPVLGICLGAQLIAEGLGSGVWKNRQKEIGFFPLRGDGVIFPAEFSAFHWHGDTFGIPDGAVRLASSAATENQAFIYKNNVLGLQFHLETTQESLQSLYSHCSGEITDAPFIQTLEKAAAVRIADGDLLLPANSLMRKCLNHLFQK